MNSKELFNAFQDLKVLIIGDSMIDAYYSGSVERISPEAPVPIVNLRKKEYRLGGAANVALNAKSLRAQPYLISVIGADEEGKVLLDLLKKEGMSTEGIVLDKRRGTTVKTRVIGNGSQMLRLDEEDTFDVDESVASTIAERIDQLLGDMDVVIFQDYNKGILTYHVIQEIILEAIKRDIPTAVDPKFKNFWA